MAGADALRHVPAFVRRYGRAAAAVEPVCRPRRTDAQSQDSRRGCSPRFLSVLRPSTDSFPRQKHMAGARAFSCLSMFVLCGILQRVDAGQPRIVNIYNFVRNSDYRVADSKNVLLETTRQ